MRPAGHPRFRVKSSKVNDIASKNKSPREKQLRPDSKVEVIRHGFSSDYLQLAKKFKANILAQKGKRHSTLEREHEDRRSNILKLRLKTEVNFQSHPNRRRTKTNQSCDISKSKVDTQRYTYEEQSSRSTLFGKGLFVPSRTRDKIFRDSVMRWGSGDIETSPPPSLKMDMGDNGAMLIRASKHSRRLLSVKEALDRLDQKEAIRLVKEYVLGDQHSNIGKIDRAFPNLQTSRQMKTFVAWERVTMISIAHNIVTSKICHLWNESSRTLQIILGFWFELMNSTYSDNLFKCETERVEGLKKVLDDLAEAKLLTIINLEELMATLRDKAKLLFKYYRVLGQKAYKVISSAQGLSINRSFYDLLGIYATYLNELDRKTSLSHSVLSFFASCPSPYILKPPSKMYTLILEGEHTLMFSPPSSSLSVVFRPHYKQFFNQLKQYYEIILFTIDLESQSKESLESIYPQFEHKLYRQHCVRLRGKMMRDCSRIGRQLSRVIICGGIQSVMKNQMENVVKLSNWEGNQDDSELPKMAIKLLEIAQQGGDLRQRLRQAGNTEIMPGIKGPRSQIQIKIPPSEHNSSYSELKPIHQNHHENQSHHESPYLHKR